MNDITKVGETLNARNAMTSLVIAEVTGKEHKSVMRDIRVIAERIFNKKGITLTSYIDKLNREKAMYKVNKKIVSLLNLNYKNKYLSNYCGQIYIGEINRFELSFKEMLEEELNVLNIKFIYQYNIDNKYKIDFFIPKHLIAIEYDEQQHYIKGNRIKDKDRENYIKNKIKCKFIRLDYREKDSINVAKVIKFILDMYSFVPVLNDNK